MLLMVTLGGGAVAAVGSLPRTRLRPAAAGDVLSSAWWCMGVRGRKGWISPRWRESRKELEQLLTFRCQT